VAVTSRRLVAGLLIVVTLPPGCGGGVDIGSGRPQLPTSSPSLSENRIQEGSAGPATTEPPAVPAVPRTVAEQGDLSAVPGTADGLAALDASLRERRLSALVSPRGDPRGSLQVQTSTGRTVFVSAMPGPATFISVTTQRRSQVPTCTDRTASGWRAVKVRGADGCSAPVDQVGIVEWADVDWTFHAEYQGASEAAVVTALVNWVKLG